MTNIKKYAIAAGLGILGALIGGAAGSIPGLVIGGAINGITDQVIKDVQNERV